MDNTNNEIPLQISIQQSKLLGNALRIKIISLLLDKPKTAKQVADFLGKSPGSVHYHILKLYNGGLIELVETKEAGGIIEKYYKAKSKWFNTKSGIVVDPALSEDFNSKFFSNLSIRLFLKEEERDEFIEDAKKLLEKWVKRTSVTDLNTIKEYAIGIKLVATTEKTED